jgi:hypothetical protein
MSIINTENTNFTDQTANLSFGTRVIQQAIKNQVQLCSTPILTVTTEASEDGAYLSKYLHVLNESLAQKSDSQSTAIYTRTPKKSNTKGLALKLLADHGMDYTKSRFTEYLLTSLIVKHIKERQVKAIFIDDIHHLTQGHTQSYINQVADWLKNLAEVTNTLLVLGGSDNSLRALELNDQFQRRIAARIQPNAV